MAVSAVVRGSTSVVNPITIEITGDTAEEVLAAFNAIRNGFNMPPVTTPPITTPPGV